MHDAFFLYALSTIPGVGAKTLRQLVGTFGNARAAWEASPQDWEQLPDIGPKTLAHFIATKETFQLEMNQQQLEAQKITLVSFLDPDFPSLLKEIPDAPALLFVRGDRNAWIEQPLIAIVGSRKYTSYGKQVVTELAINLSRAGYTIISGLAFGIDALAHEATLDAGGKTIAVLGSGIDDESLSPQSHQELAHRILKNNGVLLSELAPGTAGSIGTFPARNRIMAGMTLGTVVIEAAIDSGSLITARLALDYNREVFAVPGSIFSPGSAGTHALIRSGAKIVTGIQDILEELVSHQNYKINKEAEDSELSELSKEEQLVYHALSYEPLHIDKIIEASRLETMSVNILLTQLEIKGVIKNIGNMHYVRVKN